MLVSPMWWSLRHLFRLGLHKNPVIGLLILLETDPEILERWGYADEEGSPGQIIPSDGFWSRMVARSTTGSVNRTHRIGFSMFELFRKIDEDFGGPYLEIRNPLSCNFQHRHCTFVTIFFDLLPGCSSTWRCA